MREEGGMRKKKLKPMHIIPQTSHKFIYIATLLHLSMTGNHLNVFFVAHLLISGPLINKEEFTCVHRL